MALSMGFRMFSFLPSCHSSYGAWTLTPVGLSPTVHASLRWTHTLENLSAFDESIGLLTGQTLPVLQSARLEAAMPIGMFFTSCDPAHPEVIPAFS
jgi:hypothetical protein